MNFYEEKEMLMSKKTSVKKSTTKGKMPMHTMVIDKIDEPLMRSIRSRAALHGRTPKEEVWSILDNVARRPGFRSLDEAILNFPNVGLDSDFERVN